MLEEQLVLRRQRLGHLLELDGQRVKVIEPGLEAHDLGQVSYILANMGDFVVTDVVDRCPHGLRALDSRTNCHTDN